MAEDFKRLKKTIDFHPCDTPRGMLYYRMRELTDEQQFSLNAHKLKIMRANQKYLNDHPEVKAVTSMILREIMKARPKVKIQEFLSKYFTENWILVKEKIECVVAEKKMAREISGELDRQEDERISKKFFQYEVGVGVPVAKLDSSISDYENADEACRKILCELLNYVEEEIIEQEEVKRLVVDANEVMADSDPMLVFPFETYSTESLGSQDGYDNDKQEEEHDYEAKYNY